MASSTPIKIVAEISNSIQQQKDKGQVSGLIKRERDNRLISCRAEREMEEDGGGHMNHHLPTGCVRLVIKL